MIEIQLMSWDISPKKSVNKVLSLFLTYKIVLEFPNTEVLHFDILFCQLSVKKFMPLTCFYHETSTIASSKIEKFRSSNQTLTQL